MELFVTNDKKNFEVKDSIKTALTDLNWLEYFGDNIVETATTLIDILEPIHLTVEVLSRRESNLLSSEGAIQFLFKKLKSIDSVISKEILKELKVRLGERRQIKLVSLLKFFQNPDILKMIFSK